MKRTAIALAVTGAAALALGSIKPSVIQIPDRPQQEDGGRRPQIIVIGAQIPALATAQVQAGPSMLAKLPDGGPAYLGLFETDAGVQWLRVAAPEHLCCRAKPGGSQLLCRRGTTLSNVFYGELNRFPCSEAQPIINTCETIACAVHQGEDADLSEADLLNSTIGGILNPITGIIGLNVCPDGGPGCGPDAGVSVGQE